MRLGPYEIESEVGRGAAGIVFCARGPDGRQVAVKLLTRVRDHDAVVRFERERRLLAQLAESGGFVGLLDSGEAREGPYIVMPFVAGGTLRDRLRLGPLEIEDATALVADLATAMGRAHARGIVHRDLKPENVLFDPSGAPLIADLGLAKHFRIDADGASQSVSVSRDGAVRGTAGYMAPEQMVDARSVGPEADVFALGAILHECITGQPAFEGATVIELLARVQAGNVEPLTRHRRDVPRWLARVVAIALAPEPATRFADGEELARALRARGLGEKSGARHVLSLVLVLSLAAGAVLAGVFLALSHGRKTPLVAASPSPSPTTAPRVKPSRPRTPATEIAEEANAYVRRGDLRAALETANRAIALEQDLGFAWSVRANVFLMMGETDRALADVTKALLLDDSLVDAWGNRGMIHLQRNELDLAIEDLKQACARESREPNGWANLGEAYRRKGDFARAIECATKAIEVGPDFFAGYNIRGAARRALGTDIAGAISDLQKVVALDSSRDDAWEHLSAARFAKGDFGGALDAADHAVGIQPKVASHWRWRGKAHTLLKAYKDKDGAIADFDRAIAIEPASSVLFSERALAKRESGDPPGGIVDATRALELDPGCLDAYATRAAAYVETAQWDRCVADCNRGLELNSGVSTLYAHRGLARQMRGELDLALADADKSIELEPRSSLWRFWRARAHEYRGEVLATIEDSDKAIELDPRSLGWVTRARARFKQGKLEAALEDAKQATEFYPNFPDHWQLLAAIRESLGDHAGALEALTSAAVVLYGRGCARQNAGDTAGAIADYDAALALDSKHAPSLCNRGIAHLLRGELQAARADLDRSLELDPKPALGWKARAMLRDKQADAPGAVADFRKFLELAPDDPEVGAARARIAELEKRP